jgi:hypothetical protein
MCTVPGCTSPLSSLFNCVRECSTNGLEEYIRSKWKMGNIDCNYSVVAVLGLAMTGKCKHCQEFCVDARC